MTHVRTLCLMTLAALLYAIKPPSHPIHQSPIPQATPALPQSPPSILRCQPATTTGSLDSPLTLDLYLEHATDLYGADLRLAFNPEVAHVVDANPTAPGVQIQPLDDLLHPDQILRNTADNTAGTLRYAVAQISPHPPANGAGPLARLTFQPRAPAASRLSFTYLKLSHPDGTSLPATAQDCTIRFGTQTTCPLADVTHDGHVDIDDLQLLATHWHTTPADPRYDLDADGRLTIADLMRVAAHWGESC